MDRPADSGDKSKFQEHFQTLETAEKKAQAEKNEEVRNAALERLKPKIAFAKQQIEDPTRT